MVPIHLRTLFSSSAISILQEIAALSSKYGNKGHTIIFSLSTNFRKSKDLEAVFGKLVAFNTPRPKTSATEPQVQGNTLGCLVEPPTGIYHSQALAAYRRKQDYISCSIGVFDSANVIAFRSDLPSEEQPQVGRWHSFRKTSTAGSDMRLDQGGAPSPNGPVDWENIWAQSSLQSNSSPELPHELQTASKISGVIYFTAPHPTQLTTVLSSQLPDTTCLGLIAAPTHFITGRAVTLVMDGKIYDSGAIGLAFKDPTGRQNGKECKTTFAGFHRLSEPVVVAETEGNMLNAVKPLSCASESSESINPTSLLLHAIQKANLTAPTFKESEDFALAVLSPSAEADKGTFPIERTYTITAGDPRNRGGALSLAGHRAPKPGSVVQFIHRPRDTPITLPSIPSGGANVTFVTVPEAPSTNSTAETSTDEILDAEHPPLALDSTFLASSSRGFLLSRPLKDISLDSHSDTTWNAALPGTMATMASTRP